MKRLLSLAVVATVLATPISASAQSVNYQTDIQKLFNIKVDVQPNTYQTFLTAETQGSLTVLEATKDQPQPDPVIEVNPKVHTVVEGDTLSSIGETYNVSWTRLWAKNTQLDNPDVIHVGDQITIPDADEELSRDLPVVIVEPAVVAPTAPAISQPVAPSVSFDGSNTYAYGYCTWYVKNRRGASLPNMLGNANMWYWNAQRTGLPVGTEPRAGAVGTTTAGALGHVVYVESVNDDGTITISEMNAGAGWGRSNTRTANAHEFVYIY